MLEVKNVSYAYKTKKDKTILNNVSATFEEGIFYTIVGPSGAGKTTLLSLLAGLDTAVKGTVLCNGEDITKKGLNYHRKHNISLVFQNYWKKSALEKNTGREMYCNYLADSNSV